MRIRWRTIGLITLGTLAIVYREDIADALGRFPFDDAWRVLAEEISGMPRIGQYTVVLLVLALLYITAYMLLLNCIRRNRERDEDEEEDG